MKIVSTGLKYCQAIVLIDVGIGDSRNNSFVSDIYCRLRLSLEKLFSSERYFVVGAGKCDCRSGYSRDLFATARIASNFIKIVACSTVFAF